MDAGLPASLPVVAWSVFLWWFSTGAVLWLVGRPPRTFPLSVGVSTVLAVLALVVIRDSASQDTVTGAWQAYTGAVLVWAWLELTFYTGWLTGPRRVCCPEGCSGWPHFRHALAASLWHELALFAAIGLVAWLVGGSANPVALHTLLVLFVMHESARLNVLLGVRNLNAHLLPPHMAFLAGFLRQRSLNPLFPVSVVAGSAVFTWLLVDLANLPAGHALREGRLYVLAMLGLGLFEHWMLVLPLPFATLWNWSLRARPVP